MATVTITINKKTGAMSSHVEGIAGPACEEIEHKLEELLGKATSSERTAEYYETQKVRQTQQG